MHWCCGTPSTCRRRGIIEGDGPRYAGLPEYGEDPCLMRSEASIDVGRLLAPHQILEQSVEGIDGAPREAPPSEVMAEALNAFFSAQTLQRFPGLPSAS
jgi:hypothetical protein